MGQLFRNAPSKIYGRQPLKNFTCPFSEYLEPNTNLGEVFR